MKNKIITIEEMEQALRNNNFFIGGLDDKDIIHYYNKLIKNKFKVEYKGEIIIVEASNILEASDKLEELGIKVSLRDILPM